MHFIKTTQKWVFRGKYNTSPNERENAKYVGISKLLLVHVQAYKWKKKQNKISWHWVDIIHDNPSCIKS